MTRGRPKKPEGEKLSWYDYVRMTEAQYEKVARLAKKLGFASGGRAATIRWLIEKEEESK